MDELAALIVDLIKDYRNDDEIFIDKDHVIRWVNQFDQNDRQFILEELYHILPKSYISKDLVIREFEQIFKYLAEYNKYEDIKSFLKDSRFLSCQSEQKSQTKLLKFLTEICMKQFGFSINQNNSDNIKFWIYVDDVLASGGTFKRDIHKEILAYGNQEFQTQGIELIPIFFFLHTWGYNIVKYSLSQDFGGVFKSLSFHRVYEIENDPRINYYNSSPKFNHVYPIKPEDCDHLEKYLQSLEATNHERYAYREKERPGKEDFYSSPENRNRYEQIILKKGIEILSRAEYLSPSTRPLGLGYPSYKTFGTGSHAFTWRNISNTCPIIYWWENHNWIPLFSVANRGR